jgi:hypothetical protein
MTLTGVLILENKKILFADTLWQGNPNFNHTKIFSNNKNDYLLTSGTVSKNLICDFNKSNYNNILNLLANNYNNYITYSSFIYYNNIKEDINAYFIEKTNISKIKIDSFILIGYQAGKINEKIDSISKLYILLKNYSNFYSELIGNTFEFKILSNKKLINSYEICF